MFQDCSTDIISFPSCWKRDKTNTDGSTQTREILTYELSTQSYSYTDTAVQTEEEVKDYHYKLVVDNSADLKEFLIKVEPMVTAALKRNTLSHAFDGYKVQWEKETNDINIIHTLQYLPCSEFQCVTGISWNSTGSVIGVCYGRYDHTNWCNHKSALCTWNIDRRTIDPARPDVVVEVPTCLMCLAFHPSLPPVIATGGFTGELRIVNTAKEGDPSVASSYLVDMAHKEPIAQLSWTSDAKSKCSYIISLGNDGRILLWEWKSSQLEILQEFTLKSTAISSNLRIGKSDIITELGGTCFSFSKEDHSTFVVGCENGSLIKCSVDADASNINSVLPMFSVKYAFKPHHGPVSSLSCAPFHRNLFLSCCLDSTARLYSLLESDPLLILEPDKGYLFAITWSPTRPLIVALGTAQGQLLIYDLKSSHITPKCCLEVCNKKPVYSIEYNIHRPSVLATGDGCGIVKVYRLSSELTQQTNGEIDQLISFVNDFSFDKQ
jgi:WD40 repeat protein